MDILDIIRNMRVERGWTEYQLAEKSGLTQSTISSWYRKKIQPSISSLEHICDAFNISLSQFFAITSSQKDYELSLTELQTELVKEFSKLNQTQQNAILELIKCIK